MTFKLRLGTKAVDDIRQFADYLADYSEDVAKHYVSALVTTVERYILPRPLTWQFFFLTGAPYRACLFREPRSSQFSGFGTVRAIPRHSIIATRRFDDRSSVDRSRHAA